MTLPFSESWTGADGAAWPAAWQRQTESAGTATIQANAGRLVAPANSAAAARQQTVASLPGGDLDILATLTVPAGQGSFSIGVVWRADGTSDPAAPPGSRMFPLTGQSCRLDTNGDVHLYRHSGGALTLVTPAPVNVGAWVGFGPRRIRIQQTGTRTRVRVWAAAAAEPTTWALDFTDPGASTAGGRLSVAVSAGFGGPVGATQTVLVDDLTVTAPGAPPPPPPPPPPPAGTRRNWATMSATDRQAVIDGLQRAKTSGAYDELTRLHQRAMMGDGNEWHRRSIFLPIHRWYLARLEAAMGVAMPYWDWTAQPFPPGLGDNGNPAQNWRVTTGPFAAWVSVVYDTRTGTFLQRPGIIRQFGSAAPNLPTAAQVAGALNQQAYDAAPWNQNSTTGFRNWSEGWTGNPGPALHNRVHEWTGGDMRLATSPNDPIFWFHHCNVDRIWAGWQTRRGITNYAAPTGQGPNVPMPLAGGVTPAQVFPLPPYDLLP